MTKALLWTALAQAAGSAFGVWVAMKVSPKHPVIAAAVIGAVTVPAAALVAKLVAGADAAS